jgi:mono/diheme cytochrome c family protein
LNVLNINGLLRATIAGLALFTFGFAFAQDKEIIEAGEQVYDQNCAECHGEKLRSSGAVPDLREMPADARARFDEAVKNGRGQMPAWEGQLTPENFDQIWAYIRSRAR